jgi:hypothetical protein
MRLLKCDKLGVSKNIITDQIILIEVKLGVSGRFIQIVGFTGDKKWVKTVKYDRVRF